MSETDDTRQTVGSLLRTRAATHKGVTESDLAPLTDYVDPAVIADLFGAFTPESSSLRYGSLRFLWDDLVTTLYADGRVEFDPIHDVRSPVVESVRRGVHTQYEVAVENVYDEVTDGGATGTTATRAAGLHESAVESESYPGETFASMLRDAGGTPVDRFVDGIDVDPTDLVLLTGDGVGVNEAIFDGVLGAVADAATVLTTIRPGSACRDAIDTDVTVLDSTSDATRNSPDVRVIDQCRNLTTVGTEIVKSVGHADTDRELFGFHSLSTLAPGATPESFVRFLSVLTGKLRNWNVGGVFAGNPVPVDPKHVWEQFDYRIETRRRNGTVHARVCGDPETAETWQPVRLQSH